jgi:hypothetical protein
VIVIYHTAIRYPVIPFLGSATTHRYPRLTIMICPHDMFRTDDCDYCEQILIEIKLQATLEYSYKKFEMEHVLIVLCDFHSSDKFLFCLFKLLL